MVIWCRFVYAFVKIVRKSRNQGFFRLGMIVVSHSFLLLTLTLNARGRIVGHRTLYLDVFSHRSLLSQTTNLWFSSCITSLFKVCRIFIAVSVLHHNHSLSASLPVSLSFNLSTTSFRYSSVPVFTFFCHFSPA